MMQEEKSVNPLTHDLMNAGPIFDMTPSPDPASPVEHMHAFLNGRIPPTLTTSPPTLTDHLIAPSFPDIRVEFGSKVSLNHQSIPVISP